MAHKAYNSGWEGPRREEGDDGELHAVPVKRPPRYDNSHDNDTALYIAGAVSFIGGAGGIVLLFMSHNNTVSWLALAMMVVGGIGFP